MYSKSKPANEARETSSLMISTSSGVIVWFSRPGVGMVVSVGGIPNKYSLGEEGDNWTMENFVPFNGSVELSNHKL
jgi:hypothetical protein